MHDYILAKQFLTCPNCFGHVLVCKTVAPSYMANPSANPKWPYKAGGLWCEGEPCDNDNSLFQSLWVIKNIEMGT